MGIIHLNPEAIIVKSLPKLKIIDGTTTTKVNDKYSSIFLFRKSLSKNSKRPIKIKRMKTMSLENLNTPVKLLDCEKSCPEKRA